MIGHLRKRVIAFISGEKNVKGFWILAGIASGLYPLLYYYNANFTLINSWPQFLFFVTIFLIVPCLSILFARLIFHKIKGLSQYKKYTAPVLNFSFFTSLVVLCTYGFNGKALPVALSVAFVLGILLHNHFRKVLVFQFLLVLLISPKLIPEMYGSVAYSDAWMEQPDAIEDVVFKTRPNIYVIQPDGYANFNALKDDPYSLDNSQFEGFLAEKGFKTYSGFRSNYYTTLSSNSSLFAMKHHYYHNTKYFRKELMNARDIIAGDNPVVSIFKRNDYKTFLMLEAPYLLANRPQIHYDYCNINYRKIPYSTRGFEFKKDLKLDVEQTIVENKNTNNFYFIEKLTPGHISTDVSRSVGIDQERTDYLDQVKKANIWLQDMVDIILKNDKNAMIIIMADHGGGVGLKAMGECRIKQTDANLVSSVFTSVLAIKWSNGAPEFEDKLVSSVNFFRILFSHLGENKSYLNYLQEDKSYVPIDEGGPKGIYEVLNNDGEMVFIKHER
ncbi:hypothetical protein H7U19_03455 [Hyunsoonleella sp. SJ7]|uniref:Sulfatase N-terminal domain-containing protein n=1 Tax=Hyunsoonleella aquatilis TaxID=2762758 RepID=A0A923KJJ1_9FLAO|nr:hypothetical protein [Hyunsoonleella aquatilis]MBC3757447.1 hypothetical protein [Hyunsoonleella aquatilis]